MKKIPCENPLDNPCVRNCCLNQDDVCLGCFRTLEEILNWRKLNEVDRIALLEKCEKRRQQRSADFS